MAVIHTSVEPDGLPLVLFTAQGTPYSARFVDDSFTEAVAMPMGTRSAHADGFGNLYALDNSRVLWEHSPEHWAQSGDEFINRGALPVAAGPSTFAWTVDWLGTVHLVFASDYVAGDNLSHTRLVDGAWPPNTDLLPGLEVSVHQPYLASAADGSVHLAYGLTDVGPNRME